MVDPVTLTGLALGGAAGLLGKSLAGGSSAPTPATPPPQAAPQQSPSGSSQSLKPQQQSFIGAAATPAPQSGQKTLLGQ